MTTSRQIATSIPATTASIRAQLSWPLVTIATAGAMAGIVTGGLQYLNRSSVSGQHVAGTSAWTVHLCLFAAAALIFIVTRVVNHRRHPGRLLLLAPIGHGAAARLRYAVARRSFFRLVIAALPIAVCVYGTWRAGEQVLGGLDPSFTANAWGGPTYLGAMFCHYLDGGLVIGAGALITTLILPRPPQIKTK